MTSEKHHTMLLVKDSVPIRQEQLRDNIQDSGLAATIKSRILDFGHSSRKTSPPVIKALGTSKHSDEATEHGKQAAQRKPSSGNSAAVPRQKEPPTAVKLRHGKSDPVNSLQREPNRRSFISRLFRPGHDDDKKSKRSGSDNMTSHPAQNPVVKRSSKDSTRIQPVSRSSSDNRNRWSSVDHLDSATKERLMQASLGLPLQSSSGATDSMPHARSAVDLVTRSRSDTEHDVVLEDFDNHSPPVDDWQLLERIRKCDEQLLAEMENRMKYVTDVHHNLRCSGQQQSLQRTVTDDVSNGDRPTSQTLPTVEEQMSYLALSTLKQTHTLAAILNEDLHHLAGIAITSTRIRLEHGSTNLSDIGTGPPQTDVSDTIASCHVTAAQRLQDISVAIQQQLKWLLVALESNVSTEQPTSPSELSLMSSPTIVLYSASTDSDVTDWGDNDVTERVYNDVTDTTVPVNKALLPRSMQPRSVRRVYRSMPSIAIMEDAIAEETLAETEALEAESPGYNPRRRHVTFVPLEHI